MSRLRRFWEYITEKMFLISSSITSITILLIILFLFKEGIGIFNESPLEKEYALLINKNNPVHTLTPMQLKDVFDMNITSWKDVGGQDEPILLFRIDDINNYYTDEQIGPNSENLSACIDTIITTNKNIIAFIPDIYVPKSQNIKHLNVGKIGIIPFFTGKEWYPTAQPVAIFGILPLILGTLWISLWAIVIALPFGMAVAIYLAELADSKIRNIIKPAIELLAGIPSVVYGFFGLVVIVPIIEHTFHLQVGETGLAGSIILAIMALPTIITVAEDAMRMVPKSMREGSLALGANQWQTIHRVVIPCAISGILAAVILGIGRAIGETMAVLMVTGNAAVIPHTLFEPMRTIPATIAAELGEVASGSVHYKALFLLGCILFIITLITSITVEVLITRKQK